MGLRFWDTYALAEALSGDPRYEKIFSEPLITTRLNLLELHYALLRNCGRRKADAVFDRLRPLCTDIHDELLKAASVFRFLNASKKLSYIDCIGYVLAREKGIPFLTGDMQFQDMPGVEFIPARS